MKNNKPETLIKEMYISVDIEAAGPVPGIYSMLSIGACVVGSLEQSFYIELKPINDNFVAEALQVSRFSLESLKETGVDPAIGMEAFCKWIDNTTIGSSPVFIGFNAPFDWQFVNWYFHVYLKKNPFGINAIDIKAYYMGLTGTTWTYTSSSRLPSWLQSDNPNKHNALDDAIAQAEIFNKLLTIDRKNT